MYSEVYHFFSCKDMPTGNVLFCYNTYFYQLHVST